MKVNGGKELADKGEVGAAVTNKNDCEKLADKGEVVG
jgi:hypothetical protein